MYSLAVQACFYGDLVECLISDPGLGWIPSRGKGDKYFFTCNNRGPYISAHVLLNLFNELRKRLKCEAMLSILSLFRNLFDKFKNTGAYHVFGVKMSRICHIYLALLWA